MEWGRHLYLGNWPFRVTAVEILGVVTRQVSFQVDTP